MKIKRGSTDTNFRVFELYSCARTKVYFADCKSTVAKPKELPLYFAARPLAKQRIIENVLFTKGEFKSCFWVYGQIQELRNGDTNGITQL